MSSGEIRVSRLGRITKRGFDLFFSAAGLVFISPLLVGVVLAIKLDDGGPVFFRQRRVGQYGRPFLILKFRTMITEADAHGPKLTRNRDSRITRVGRMLRRTKIDELPQLWNVLRGEMSFVGPRPEIPRYVEMYTAEQRRILSLKPGMTDLASVMFYNEEALFPPGEDPEKFYLEYCLPRKIELSLLSARRSSLWFDTCLILRTFVSMRRSKISS